MGFLSDIAGSFLGSGFDALIGGRQASKNREFQNQMSSTAHQREVHDLKLAGLNPILSAGGRGASSPSGNMAPATGLGQAAAGVSSRAIQRKHMTASVTGMNNQNVQSALDAKYQTDAYELYKSDPTVKRAVAAGILGKKAGSAPIGAIVGGGSSAVQRLKNLFVAPTYKHVGPKSTSRKTKHDMQKIIDEAMELYDQANPEGFSMPGGLKPTHYGGYRKKITGNNKTGFNLGGL